MADFDADPRRATSGRLTFGETWRSLGGGPWAVVWIKATGEVVAIRDGNNRAVDRQRAGDSADKRSRDDEREVVLLGVERSTEAVHAALTGWEQHVSGPNGLAWVAERFDLPDAGGATRDTPPAEMRLGSTWRTQGDGPWRVVWDQATGRVLAIKGDGPRDPIERASWVPSRDAGDGDAPRPAGAIDGHDVVVIAVEPDRDRLNAALHGWEDHVDESNGLAWLAARFDAPTYPAGWYPDPWRPRSDRYRWWDSTRWTHETIRPLGSGVLRRRPTEAKPREPVPVFAPRATGWIVAGVAMSIVLGRVLAHVLGEHVAHLASLGVIALYVPLYSGLAATCLLVSRRFGSGRVSSDFGWRFQLGDLLRGLLVWVVAGLAAGLATSPWHADRVVRRTSDLLHYSDTHAPIVATIVFVASALLAAPLLEELVFRGALLRSLTPRVGTRGAIVVQAVCFGAYHFAPEFGRWNIPNMVATAMIGLVAGIAATRWRRLGPGMVAHALFNTIHVIVIFTSR